MQQSYTRRQADVALSRAALGMFCLVLLLAPTLHAQSQPGARRSGPGRQQYQRARNSTVRRVARRDGAWCSAEVTGCSRCLQETPTVAPGAQFPGSSAPPKPEPIVRCIRCRRAGYTFDAAQENCGCAAGFGTAFANGTLILVATFDPPQLPTSMSDTLVFPEPSSSNSTGNSSSTTNKSRASSTSSTAAAVPEAAAATVARFAEAPAGDARVHTTLLPKDAQRELQPAYRHRFESYMRANGYSVRTTRRGTFVSQQASRQMQHQQLERQEQAPSALRFSSTDAPAATGSAAAAMPAGESAQEQPLVCAACKGNMVSIGGPIGGSYCMPCEAGTQPDATRTTCETLQ